MPTLTINGKEQQLDVPDDMPLLWALASFGPDRHKVRVRGCSVRGVHRASRWPSGSILHHSCGQRCWQEGHDHRGDRRDRERTKIQRAWLNIEVIQCGYCQSARSWPRQLSLRAIQIRPTLISTQPCRAISAVAARTYASARPSNRHRNPRETIRGSNAYGLSIKARNSAEEPLASYFSRDQCRCRRRIVAWVLFARRIEARAQTTSDEILSPNAFVRIRPDDSITLVMPQVEMDKAPTHRCPCSSPRSSRLT